MPDLPSGSYEVRWTSLSAIDGDTASGSFAFEIDPAAPEPTATAPSSETTAEPTPYGTPAGSLDPAAADGDGADRFGLPLWVVVAAAAIVGSAGLGAWALSSDDRGGGR